MMRTNGRKRCWVIAAAVVVVLAAGFLIGCPDGSLLDLVPEVEQDPNGTNGETGESDTYTVTYHANEATSGTAPDSQTKTRGVDLTLATNTGNLARTGYSYAGWNTEAGGSGTDYAEGATYTTDANRTLFAKWQPVGGGEEADLNGAWRGEWINNAYPDDAKVVNLMIAQSGSAISGDGGWAAAPTVPYTPDVFMKVEHGNVADADFEVTLSDVGNPGYTVSMIGTLNGTAIGGSWSSSDAETGTFTMEPHTFQVPDTGPAGGIVFYDKGESSAGWRYLEAAPASTEWTNKPWGGYGTEVGSGAQGTAIGTGAANTQAIVTAYGDNEPHDDRADYAAKLCAGLEDGVFNDWFLPSKDELNQMYLQSGAIGGFASAYYWSSSELNASLAWLQYFDYGNQLDFDKYTAYRVRAARAF